MADIRIPQNPGIGGFDEFTTTEEAFIQNISSLSYAQGDMLYHNGTSIVRLPIGTASQVLKVNAGATAPEWSTSATAGTPTFVNTVEVTDPDFTNSAEIAFGVATSTVTASLVAASIDETKLDASVNASLDLADSATQPGDNISTLTNDSGYTTNTGDALVANPLSQFASTTSAQLAGVISDETGSGALVFGISPTLVTPILGTPTSVTLTNATGLPLTTGVTGTLPVTNGGTGRATSTTAYGLIAAGTTATGAHQTLATGATTQILVGGGASALPIWTTATGSGAPVRATSPTLVTPNIGVATGTSLSLGGVAVPTISSTSTFTNKRITPRVTSETSSATPTINTDNSDAHTITALAVAITSFTTNLSGTPTNFQKLIIRIKDNGTARAITWGASFEAKGVALPTTTVISKVLTVGFIYDTVTAKWGCVASAQEA